MFFDGRVSSFDLVIFSDFTKIVRVSSGSITASIKPLEAATYGLANLSLYSFFLFLFLSPLVRPIRLSPFEDDVGGSLWAHYCYFGMRPAEYQIGSHVA